MKNIFKTVIAFSFFTFQLVSTYAQVPQAFNYQAIARNTGGVAMANRFLTVQFTIHDGSGTGATIYTEQQGITTNEFGLFTAEIGRGFVVNGNFGAINWGIGGGKYLQVEIDTLGLGNYTNLGNAELLSVPYALYSGSGSGSGVSGTWNTIAKFSVAGNSVVDSHIAEDTSGNVGIGTAYPYSRLHVKSTGSELLFLEGNNPYLRFYNGTGSDGAYLHDGFTFDFGTVSNSNKNITLSPNGNTVMVITGAGKIGINTIPTQDLDVAGNVQFTGALMPNSAAGFAGQILKSNGPNIAPSWVTARSADGNSNISLFDVFYTDPWQATCITGPTCPIVDMPVDDVVYIDSVAVPIVVASASAANPAQYLANYTVDFENNSVSSGSTVTVSFEFLNNYTGAFQDHFAVKGNMGAAYLVPNTSTQTSVTGFETFTFQLPGTYYFKYHFSKRGGTVRTFGRKAIITRLN